MICGFVKRSSETFAGRLIVSTQKTGASTRRRMSENYIGSDFDDFLAEEGLLEEAEALTVNRILTFQIKELMARRI
jgi:hypothetical protein